MKSTTPTRVTAALSPVIGAHNFVAAMKLFVRRVSLRPLLMVVVFLASVAVSNAQPYDVYWKSDAANGNWADWNLNNWYRTSDGWSVRRPDLPNGQWAADYTPKTYNIIHFDNASYTTTTVNGDVGGTAFYVNQLLLQNSSDRTFNSSSGGYLEMGGGSGNAKIESVSGSGTGNYTFNVGIYMTKATEINAVGGNITFGSSGTINNNGNTLISYTTTGKTLTLGGSVSGSGGFQHKGAGLVILSASNSYTGATTVEASGGVVQIKNKDALGTAANGTSISSGAALEIYGSLGTIAEGLTLNGTGVSSGGGLRNLSGSSTWGGAITLGSASRINSDTGTLTIDVASGNAIGGSYALTIGGAGNVTVNDAIAIGGANLAKDGAGVLTLGAVNSYTGETQINQGTLAIGSSGGLANSSMVYLGSGNNNEDATLSLSGTTTLQNAIQANSSLNNGAGGRTIVKTDGTSQSISGNFTNNRASTINVTDASGNLTISGAVNGSSDITKTGSGTLTLSANNSGFSGATVIDAGTLALSGSGSIGSSSQVKVGTNATFDISGVTTSATVAAISEQAGSGDGGSLKMGSKGLTMNGGNTTYYFNNLGVSGDTGTFTLNAGNSTLSLYGASQYTGATTLSAGTLKTSAAMSSASYALGGGNLTTEAGANLSDTAAVTLSSGSSTFTVGASDTIGSIAGTAGKISIATNVVLTAGASGNTTFSGVIDGTGAFVKSGTGTLTFDGSSANTYSGTTTVNAGTLVLGKNGVNALAGTPTINNGGTIKLAAGNQFAGDTTFLTVNSGGVFDMNNFNETLAIQGTNGTVKLGSGTITINPTMADSFAGTIEGTGAVIKTNTGTQVMAGNSTYKGTTTVGQGILVAAHANALGATDGATTVNTGAALQLSNGSSMTVVEALTLNGSGVNGVDGALRNVGGANTVSGSITLGSNARIGATAGTLSVGNIGGGANVLYVGGTGNSFITGVLSGAGNTQEGTTTSLYKDGASVLTLSGANDYSGDTRISEGNLTVASGGNLGNGTSDVYIANGASLAVNANATVASLREWGTTNGGLASIGSGATLTISGSAYEAYQNSISGAGALTKSGTGTLGLYGTQGYTGKTTVSAGLLKLQSDIVSFASTNVEVSTGGTFQTQSANVLSDSSAIAVTGGTVALGGNDTVTSFEISSGELSTTNSSTLTASGGYALKGGTVSANLGTGTATASVGTTALNGNLGGALVANSGGTVDLGGTVAGNVTVSGGTVNLKSSDRLGGGVTISSGTLGMGTYTDAVSSFEITGGTLGGSGTLSSSGGYALKGGTVSANLGAGTATASTATTALNGNLGGALVANSGGTVDLSGTVAGNVTVSGGTVNLKSSDRLGSGVTISSGTLGMGTYNDEVSSFEITGGTLGGSGTLSSSGGYALKGGTVSANLGTGTATASVGTTALNGNLGGALVANSGGTVDLGGTVAGNVTVSGGTVNLKSSDRLGGGVTISSGTLGMGTYTDAVSSFEITGGTLGGSGTLSSSGGYALKGGTVSANLGTGTATASVGTTALNGNLGGALVANTGGTVTLGGTVAGDVTVSGGTVNLGSNNRLADGATVSVSNGELGMGSRTDAVSILNVSGGSVTGSSGNKLTAGTYNLTGGTVGANLGGGTLNANSGSATLNGTADATTVNVGGGSLGLGSAGRLASGAAVTVTNSGTLTLGGDETVTALTLNSGTLGGSGKKLTASTYALNGGTVTANLGAGAATAASGTTALNGTLDGSLAVSGGTVNLGASDRIGDSAVIVSSGTLGMGVNNDTVSSFEISGGTLGGSGTLTASTYALKGGTVTANLGAGAATASTGTTALNGTLDGSLAVSGGTVNLGSSDRIGNSAVTISSGTLGMGTYTDTVSSFEISGGTLGGSGKLTASTYALKGGTVTANLGAGTATAASGTTSLNGTLDATTVNVGGGTVNLGSNNRLADSATVSVSSGELGMGGNTDTITTLNVSGGSVSGTSGNKLTAGTYNLTGGTVGANLGGGTLNANSGSATLNGTADATTVNVGGGSLGLGSAGRLASGAGVTISNSGTLTLGGNETIASLAGSGGTLALGGNTLSVGSGNFGGVISGLNGILTKTGSGTLTLSGLNTYSGGTFLNGGTLDADNSSAFGTGSVTVGSGTILDLVSHNVANRIINNGGTILSSGTLSDVVATNGTTDIGGDNSTIVDVGGAAVVNVTGSSVVVSNASGGTLNADGSGVQVASVSGTATVNLGGSSAVVNTASGGTVNANAAGATVNTVNGATLNVAGNNARVATLSSGNVSANAAGLVVTNYNGGNIAVSNGVTVALRGGSSSGAISGAGGIAKQGASTLTLSGANTYSGGTTVEAGKLVVNGSATNSAVTVASGAILGGSGAVGETTLLSGATIAPGNSPGTLTIEGDHSWAGGSSYDWEIYNVAGTPGSAWDLIDVNGALLFSGLSAENKFTINLFSLYALPSTLGSLAGWDSSKNWTWTILSANSPIPSINASYFTLNDTDFVSYNALNGGTFSLAAAGNDLNLLFTAKSGPGPEPIPEPGTWAAAALLAGGAGFVGWRRRKQQGA